MSERAKIEEAVRRIESAPLQAVLLPYLDLVCNAASAYASSLPRVVEVKAWAVVDRRNGELMWLQKHDADGFAAPDYALAVPLTGTYEEPGK